MSLLGVIGGMGVQTTARFYNMLTQLQTVTNEQQYIDILVYSKSSTPDRTAFITGKSNISPLDSLIHAAKTLEQVGATHLVMPCVTAHYFYNKLNRAVSIPFINIVRETAKHVKKCGLSKVGLLATSGTIQGGFLQKTFDIYEIEVVLPNKKVQGYLMRTIYNLKQGKPPENALKTLSENIDAEAIILGCTELGLLEKPKGYEYIEAMEILARAAIKEVKREKHTRISGTHSN